LTLTHGFEIISIVSKTLAIETKGPEMNQRDRVRALAYCLCCKGPKEIGLLICWPCHRSEKRANGGGYSPKTELLIVETDRSLAQLADALGQFVEHENAKRDGGQS
jgi:hypothetical protein